MAEPDVIFKNGGYMNVSEGKVYIDVYRYPQHYPISSTLLLNVMPFWDTVTFALTTATFKNGRREIRENSKNCLFEIRIP